MSGTTEDETTGNKKIEKCSRCGGSLPHLEEYCDYCSEGPFCSSCLLLHEEDCEENPENGEGSIDCILY